MASPLEHPEMKHFLSKYKPGKYLNRGASAKVHLCTRHVDKVLLAAKTIDVTRPSQLRQEALTMRQMTLREISVLRTVKGHKNVIELLDTSDLGHEMTLVFEYCPNGDLCSYLGKKHFLHETEALKIMKQVLEAVQYCHKLGIVHRDIKPENILLDADFNVKLTDFGFSRKLKSGEMMTQFCGTLEFMAPELILASKPPRSGAYSFEVDDWACGVVLYILLSGCYPFKHADREQELNQIIEGQYSMEGSRWDYVSKPVKDMISGFLTVNPARRLTAACALALPLYRSQSNRPEEGLQELQNAPRRHVYYIRELLL